MEYWEKLRAAYGHDTLILSGVGGAIIQDGSILLVRNKEFGKWQVPGGLQEVGESIQQALEREIREELNLNMKASRLISIYSHPKWTGTYPNGDWVQPLGFFFLMTGDISDLTIQESEISEARFFSPGNLPNDTMEYSRQQVLDWVQNSSQVLFR